MVVMGLTASVLPAVVAESPHGKFEVPKEVGIILEDNCQSCHEDGTAKGDVRLDNLGALPLITRLDLMNKMLEQVYLKQMPPKKKAQPSEEERNKLGAWLWEALHSQNASKLEDKLRYPSYGNYVDHDKLFSSWCCWNRNSCIAWNSGWARRTPMAARCSRHVRRPMRSPTPWAITRLTKSCSKRPNKGASAPVRISNARSPACYRIPICFAAASMNT